MAVICPKCKSNNIEKRELGKKVGMTTGGILGLIMGAGAIALFPTAGKILTPALGIVATRLVAGAITGSAGAKVGESLDGIAFDIHRCRDCDETFD